MSEVLIAGGVGVVVGLVMSVWAVGAWRRFRQFRRLRGSGVKYVINAPTTFHVNALRESEEIEIRLVTDDPDMPVVGMTFGIGGAYDLANLIKSVTDDVNARFNERSAPGTLPEGRL